MQTAPFCSEIRNTHSDFTWQCEYLIQPWQTEDISRRRGEISTRWRPFWTRTSHWLSCFITRGHQLKRRKATKKRGNASTPMVTLPGMHSPIEGFSLFWFIFYIPSGHLTVRHGKSRFCSVNHLVLWSMASIAHLFTEATGFSGQYDKHWGNGGLPWWSSDRCDDFQACHVVDPLDNGHG